MTLDGKIATRTGKSQWITGESARARVHALRGRMDAIIVGRGTLLADDPLLTARPPGPRTATRIVLTTTGKRMPSTCRLLESVQDAPVLVATTAAADGHLVNWRDRGAEVISFPTVADGIIDIKSVLTELGRRGMTNVLVEGGAGTLGSFLDGGEIDEVYAFVAPRLFGGLTAPSPLDGLGVDEPGESIPLTDCHCEQIGNDFLIRGIVQSSA
jgi:diaminohydroxyphosphoribosylaminopyrimidine deaminase/5-amino-6-(5-phosphoribosylamino)uracil reductase